MLLFLVHALYQTEMQLVILVALQRRVLIKVCIDYVFVFCINFVFKVSPLIKNLKLWVQHLLKGDIYHNFYFVGDVVLQIFG